MSLESRVEKFTRLWYSSGASSCLLVHEAHDCLSHASWKDCLPRRLPESAPGDRECTPSQRLSPRSAPHSIVATPHGVALHPNIGDLGSVQQSLSQSICTILIPSTSRYRWEHPRHQGSWRPTTANGDLLTLSVFVCRRAGAGGLHWQGGQEDSCRVGHVPRRRLLRCPGHDREGPPGGACPHSIEFPKTARLPHIHRRDGGNHVLIVRVGFLVLCPG